jgi:hypothetical protein
VHSWGPTSGDAGYIDDPADPATLDPADSRYMRADHPAVPAYTTESSLRPRLQLSRTTSTRCGAGPASERLRGD